MRPGTVETDELEVMEDMEEAVLEEQNESMREEIVTRTAVAELMAMRGEPIRVRPRLVSSSSDEAPLRYVRQWPEYQSRD
eukprot:4597796-Heterocapsa_arctica.AAC.1